MPIWSRLALWNVKKYVFLGWDPHTGTHHHQQHRPRRHLWRHGASLGLVKRNQINLQLDLVPFNQLQRRMSYSTRSNPGGGAASRPERARGADPDGGRGVRSLPPPPHRNPGTHVPARGSGVGGESSPWGATPGGRTPGDGEATAPQRSQTDQAFGETKPSGAVSWKFAVLTSPEALVRSTARARQQTGRTRLRRDPSHPSVQWLPPPRPATMYFVGSVIGATAGIGVSVVVVPACLWALGFTSAGIAAGSVAAKMMSLTALANGGQVAAGSLVAIAQSLGAAGVPNAVTAALSATGALIGGL
ncbi:uncharacterized protein LOC141934988 [Strix aluco]|uniref:uncharacterized protein LOC141934988 n=1 Tax=Strix aluco TaxID=111821 RepID=UPI003DA66903